MFFFLCDERTLRHLEIHIELLVLYFVFENKFLLLFRQHDIFNDILSFFLYFLLMVVFHVF